MAQRLGGSRLIAWGVIIVAALCPCALPSHADVAPWQLAQPTAPWDRMRKAPLWEFHGDKSDQFLYSLRVALTSPRLDDVRGAIAQLQAVAQPSDVMRTQLGEAYFRVGQFKPCREILAPLVGKEDLPVPSGNAESIAVLFAHCQARAGQPDRAISLLQSLIRRGSESATTWFLLGEALVLRGDWRKANDAFLRSLQIQRSGSAAWAAAVTAELAFGQIEGERAALMATGIDSRATGWRRAYLGSATTIVSTIAPAYEYVAQALLYRALERYTDALAMARLANATLLTETTPPAIKRDLGARLTLLTTYLTALAARADLRATGMTLPLAEAAIAPHLPSLRACAKPTPKVVYEIRLARGSVTVKPANNDDATGVQISAAVDCQKAISKKIKLQDVTSSEPAPQPPNARPRIVISAGNRPPEIVFRVISL